MADTENTRPRRGMAIFAVLSLVVIFTVLGVGMITLAQRDNATSGSTLDIKSRESAAYAGLVYALGELQRNPANAVALLEGWRTGTIYGGNAPAPLYFKFDNANGVLTLTTTKPALFTPPGSTSQILVQLDGIYVPPDAATAPVISLRSTGTGRSGDAQTVIGVYEIQNVVFSQPVANLGITHSFYLNSPGIINNLITSNNGDVYLGGNMTFNAATAQVQINNGGLHLNGNLFYNAGISLNVTGNSWVTGSVTVQGNGINFQQHLVINGGLSFNAPGTMTVQGALVVQGSGPSGGIWNLNSGTLNVGSVGVANSELYVPNGPVATGNAGGRLLVTGPAYIHQLLLNSLNGNGTQLSVTGRMEWSDNAALTQQFYGTGSWGQLVARSCYAGSYVQNPPYPVTPGLTIGPLGNSWIETPLNFMLGTSAAVKVAQTNAPARTTYGNGSTAKIFQIGGTAPVNGQIPAANGIRRKADVLTVEGFDGGTPPTSVVGLGMNIPAAETEVGFDPNLDPTIAASAWTATGSNLCNGGGSRQCGAGLNAAYNADVAAGSHHFHNGFFVVKITAGMQFDWDLGGAQTTPLNGKYLFLVQTAMAQGSNPWPTTATNANPASPTNVEFIFADAATGGDIFPGFAPRYLNNNTTPVVFCGYVRETNASNPTWNPVVPTTILGAVHVVGTITGNMQINSGSASAPIFTLDQNVLGVVGNAFGSAFTNPVTGQPLVNPALMGFALTENWIQFRPLGELR
jgi:hypothetical protein